MQNFSNTYLPIQDSPVANSRNSSNAMGSVAFDCIVQIKPMVPWGDGDKIDAAVITPVSLERDFPGDIACLSYPTIA